MAVETEDARQRLILLADASAVLASSLDYETTLTSVAEAVVPRIADWCAVHLVDEDGTVRQVTVTHSDPAKAEVARELEGRFPYDPDAAVGVPAVVRTGQPELVSEVPDELLVSAVPDAELLQIFRDLGLKSWMVIPLSARGHILGTITFVAAESGRHYGPDDVALVEVLARRAALAIDNARLYQEAQRVAAERSAILAQLTEGVILCDVTGTVTFMHDAARRIYGRNSVGRSVSRYWGSASLFDSQGEAYAADALPLYRALTEGVVTIDAEARLRRVDGTEVIVQRSATPVTGDDSTRLGAVLTIRDVTMQRTIEEQKDEFLSAAAHDLKTPLTSLKGLAQVLQRRVTREGGPGSEEIVDGLARMERITSRMNSLINELLDVSHLQMRSELQLDLRPTDLVSLVSRSVAEYRETGRNQPITMECLAPQLVGNWDADRLERVITNLLSNATKYSAEDESITVTLREESRDDAAWAVISIKDGGIGIADVDLPHIFERFYYSNTSEGGRTTSEKPSPSVPTVPQWSRA